MESAPDGDIIPEAHIFFFIDDELCGSFNHTSQYSNVAEFNYHVLLWENSTLIDGPHVFTLRNGDQSGNLKSLTLLDYIVYT